MNFVNREMEILALGFTVSDLLLKSAITFLTILNLCTLFFLIMGVSLLSVLPLLINFGFLSVIATIILRRKGIAQFKANMEIRVQK
jgi:uncharacterized membrane protein